MSIDIDSFEIKDESMGAIEDDPLRLTMTYSYASTPEFDGTQAHHLGLRFQLDMLQNENLYYKVDGKVLFRLPEDGNLDPGDDYALDYRLRELAARYSTEDWSLKLGVQERIWSELNTSSLLNILSPSDFSEYSYTSPEDSRLGQPMIGFTLFRPSSSLELVFNPMPQVNKYPGEIEGLMEDVFQIKRSAFTISDNKPDAFSDVEVAARWKKTTENGDVSLMVASLLSNDPLTSVEGVNSAGQLQIRNEYPRYEMAGMSASYSQGNFLWQAELSYSNDIAVPTPIPMESDAYGIALGMEYNANDSYNLAFEFVQQHLLTNQSLQGLNRDNTFATARWSKNFRHDTVTFSYFVGYQFQYGDIIQSAALTYQINDDLRAELNATFYDISDPESTASATDNWDQIGVRISLAF